MTAEVTENLAHMHLDKLMTSLELNIEENKKIRKDILEIYKEYNGKFNLSQYQDKINLIKVDK